MNYDIKIDSPTRPRDKRAPLKSYLMAGISAIAINTVAVTSLMYMSPWYFSEWKGDKTFSTEKWEGYVRCENKIRNIAIFREGKLISIENAIADYPKEFKQKGTTIEEIVEATKQYDCKN